jgi:hypothetical protein
MDPMQEQQQTGGDDADTQTFKQMVNGLVGHMFGAGEEGIKKRLRDGAQQLPQTMGTLALTMIEEATRQADEAGAQYDTDMLLGVASEVIDNLIDMADAMGLIEGTSDDNLREDAMMHAVESYAMTAEPGSEEQEAAQQMLQQFQQDGTMAEAEATIAEMGKRRGVDPFSDGDAPVDGGQSAGQPAPGTAGPRPLMQGA